MSQTPDSPLSPSPVWRRTQECAGRLAADPKLNNKEGCERNFWNQLKYDETGIIIRNQQNDYVS
jgi:hypothetical protein